MNDATGRSGESLPGHRHIFISGGPDVNSAPGFLRTERSLRAHGRFVQANPGAARIFGLDLDALLDRGVEDPRWKGIDEDGAPLAPEALPGAETMRTRIPFRNHVLGLLQDEQDPLWLQFSGGPLPDGGVLLTFDDITDRHPTEAYLEARARTVAVEGVEKRTTVSIWIPASAPPPATSASCASWWWTTTNWCGPACSSR